MTNASDNPQDYADIAQTQANARVHHLARGELAPSAWDGLLENEKDLRTKVQAKASSKEELEEGEECTLHQLSKIVFGIKRANLLRRIDTDRRKNPNKNLSSRLIDFAHYATTHQLSKAVKEWGVLQKDYTEGLITFLTEEATLPKMRFVKTGIQAGFYEIALASTTDWEEMLEGTGGDIQPFKGSSIDSRRNDVVAPSKRDSVRAGVDKIFKGSEDCKGSEVIKRLMASTDDKDHKRFTETAVQATRFIVDAASDPESLLGSKSSRSWQERVKGLADPNSMRVHLKPISGIEGGEGTLPTTAVSRDDHGSENSLDEFPQAQSGDDQDSYLDDPSKDNQGPLVRSDADYRSGRSSEAGSEGEQEQEAKEMV